MGRLTLVGPTRIEVIVRTDQKVELLFHIPVEVADQQAECAVGVFEPAFVCGRDALTAFVGCVQRELLVCRRVEGSRDDRNEGERDRPQARLEPRPTAEHYWS